MDDHEIDSNAPVDDSTGPVHPTGAGTTAIRPATV